MAPLRPLRSAIVPILGYPSFRWFLLCTFASALGRNGYAVACTWILVASDGGSAAVATFVAVVSLTELLVSPIAGWISDRFKRRPVFIAADVIRMLASLALMSTDLPWVIYTAAGLFAACDRIALTASQSMIPSVGAHLKPDTSNSISFFCMQVGGLIAAGLVGMLLHVISVPAAFATISAAFFISFISMAFVSGTHSRPRTTDTDDPRRLNVDARFVYLACLFALLYGGGTLVSILGAGLIFDEFGGNALDFGKLESAWSAGSIVGAILLIPLAHYAKHSALLIGALMLIALSFASLKLSPLLWTLATFAALGTFYNLGRVAVEVMLQATVSNSALGRAKGIFHCAGVSMGLILFGAVSIGAHRLEPSTMFLLYGVIMMAAAGVLICMRHQLGRITRFSTGSNAN